MGSEMCIRDSVMSDQIQGLKDDHDEMRETVNGTMVVVTGLREEVEATKTAMAAITGFFTSLTDIFGRIPTILWIILWIGVLAATLGLICALPGGPTLLTIAGQVLVTGLRLALSHSSEIIAAIFTLFFFTFIESPTHVIHRWQTTGISTFEQVFAAVWLAIVLSAWAVAFVRRRFEDSDDKDQDSCVLPVTMTQEEKQKKRGGWLNVADWYNQRTGTGVKDEGKLSI